MQVIPLAADSLGVHSMATLVAGHGGSILIDPGALAAGAGACRWENLAQARAAVVRAAARSVALFVTSYAHAHHNLIPDCPAHLPVYLKTPDTSWEFQQACALAADLAAPRRTIAFAGGARLTVAGLTIDGLPGRDAMMVAVSDGTRSFVHASTALNYGDSAAATARVLAASPDLLYLSGPALDRVDGAALDADERARARQALRGLLQVVRTTGCEALVDHDLLRAADYRRLYAPAFETGRVFTVAERLRGNTRAIPQPAAPVGGLAR